MEKIQYLILIVENNTGVLARITSLFCQRGFNILSLNVAETENPKISRITVVSQGDDSKFEQIIKQTSKLVEVCMVFPLEPSFSLVRELLLVKIACEDNQLPRVEELASFYGAKIIDQSVGCVVLELTDAPETLDRFVAELAPVQILELCRTGVTGLERGKVTYSI